MYGTAILTNAEDIFEIRDNAAITYHTVSKLVDVIASLLQKFAVTTMATEVFYSHIGI